MFCFRNTLIQLYEWAFITWYEQQFIMDNNFSYKFIKPGELLADFVESIGMFHTASVEAKEVVVIPDGRIDLFFTQSASAPFHVCTYRVRKLNQKQRSIPPQTIFFDINFKPLAVEYILQTSIADSLNSAKNLPADFWNFNADDLKDFDAFYEKASQKNYSSFTRSN